MKAYSLLEFLLATSLALALLYQGAHFLFGIEQAVFTHFRHAYEASQLKRAQSLVAIAVYENDMQRLHGLLRTLPALDFLALKNPPKNLEHQVAKDSNILYSMELESKELFVVKEKKRESSAEGVDVRVCKRSPGRRSAFSSYALAIGIHQTHCARISSGRYPAAGCSDLHLEPWDCFATPKKRIPVHLFDVQALIPVRREYLLYASRGEILRYLGIEGHYVVENQPVAERIKNSFFLFSASSKYPGLSPLQARFLSQGDITLELSHKKHLTSISSTEFLAYGLLDE